MSWLVILGIVVAGGLKIVITCQPTIVVEWFLRKFELHSTLNNEQTSILFNDISLEGIQKEQFIHDFNKCIFVKQYYIHKGNERYYTHPEHHTVPYVIQTVKGKDVITLTVYIFDDRIDVVKQRKKKLWAYSLYSETLHKKR